MIRSGASPFRYPGAKRKLASEILRHIPKADHYLDLFVGGGSILCALAAREPKAKLIANDLDPRIFAFWRYIAESPDTHELCDRITAFRPTVEAFRRMQREEPTCFTALALNRCAFSGILHGNPIGGDKQLSDWKVDCRYNAKALVGKVRALHALLHGRLTATGLDFAEALKSYPDAFVYADPPYIGQGKALYAVQVDHARLAECLRQRRDWLLSYDDCAEAHALYPGCEAHLVEKPHARYSIAGPKKEWRRARELLLKPTFDRSVTGQLTETC